MKGTAGHIGATQLNSEIQEFERLNQHFTYTASYEPQIRSIITELMCVKKETIKLIENVPQVESESSVIGNRNSDSNKLTNSEIKQSLQKVASALTRYDTHAIRLIEPLENQITHSTQSDELKNVMYHLEEFEFEEALKNY